MTETVKDVDEAIATLGTRSFIPEEEIPSFLDYQGTVITQKKNNKILRYAPYLALLNLLLDKRNELKEEEEE
jgi:hypothetical protein